MGDPVLFERNERYRRVIRTQPHDIIRAALREASPGEANLSRWVAFAPTADVLRVVLEESERIGYSDEDYRSFLNDIGRFMFGDGAKGRVALEFARRHPLPPGLRFSPRRKTLETFLWNDALSSLNFNSWILAGVKVFRGLGTESFIFDLNWENIVPALREGVFVDDRDGRCRAIGQFLYKYAPDAKPSRAIAMWLTWFSDLSAELMIAEAKALVERSHPFFEEMMRTHRVMVPVISEIAGLRDVMRPLVGSHRREALRGYFSSSWFRYVPPHVVVLILEYILSARDWASYFGDEPRLTVLVASKPWIAAWSHA